MAGPISKLSFAKLLSMEQALSTQRTAKSVLDFAACVEHRAALSLSQRPDHRYRCFRNQVVSSPSARFRGDTVAS